MSYFYFLTSLEVNSLNRFYYQDQQFNYTFEGEKNDYDYELDLITPDKPMFNGFEKLLEINQKDPFAKIQYQTHIPVQIKLQQEYFKNKKELTTQLSQFINNLLTLYEYFYNDYGLPSFKLDGRKILYKNDPTSSWNVITYEPIQANNFFEQLKESIVYGEAALDLVCMLARKREPLEFNWTLLIEGIKAFYNGNFRQTFINCCTSIEVTVTDPILSWLKMQTLMEPSDQLNQLLYEISNPLKFDIYIHTINPEPYKIYTVEELKQLILELKALNSNRNNVAHRGYRPSITEAKKGIEATSNFLRALWIFERPDFYNELKKR